MRYCKLLNSPITKLVVISIRHPTLNNTPTDANMLSELLILLEYREPAAPNIELSVKEIIPVKLM
jgi:hypothetical protein